MHNLGQDGQENQTGINGAVRNNNWKITGFSGYTSIPKPRGRFSKAFETFCFKFLPEVRILLFKASARASHGQVHSLSTYIVQFRPTLSRMFFVRCAFSKTIYLSIYLSIQLSIYFCIFFMVIFQYLINAVAKKQLPIIIYGQICHECQNILHSRGFCMHPYVQPSISFLFHSFSLSFKILFVLPKIVYQLSNFFILHLQSVCFFLSLKSVCLNNQTMSFLETINPIII